MGEAAHPVAPPVAVTADPGRVVGLVGSSGYGLTRLGLTMLAPHARTGAVAVVDVRGWLCPLAAWEAGVDAERLVVVRCSDRARWGQVTAALLGGIAATYAEVPPGTDDRVLWRLAAIARSRSAALVLRTIRGGLPGGIAHLRIEGDGITWEGTKQGHGRLGRRRLIVRVTGKAVGGIERIIEVEDDGTDTVHVVPRLASAPAGRAVG